MFVFRLILYDVSVLFIAFNNPVWNQRCLHCMLRKWPLPPPAIQRGKPLSSTFHPRLAATNVREPTNTNEWFRRDNVSKSFRMLVNIVIQNHTIFYSQYELKFNTLWSTIVKNFDKYIWVKLFIKCVCKRSCLNRWTAHKTSLGTAYVGPLPL